MGVLRYALTITAVALGFALATADVQAQQIGLRLGGGTSSPVGSFSDDDGADARLGAHFMGALELGAPLVPIRGRAEIGWFNFCTPLCPEDDLSARYQVLFGGVAAVLPFRNPSSVEPYLLAGTGLYRFSIEGSDAGFFDQDSESDIGVNGGVGVDVRLGSIGLFAEGRYHVVFTEGDNLTFIPATVGVRFGGR